MHMQNVEPALPPIDRVSTTAATTHRGKKEFHPRKAWLQMGEQRLSLSFRSRPPASFPKKSKHLLGSKLCQTQQICQRYFCLVRKLITLVKQLKIKTPCQFWDRNWLVTKIFQGPKGPGHGFQKFSVGLRLSPTRRGRSYHWVNVSNF